MVKLTKIYTRTGDSGQTHLAGGHRISKTSLRIEAIGDVDELNCWIGMMHALASEGQFDDTPFIKRLFEIQQQLFNLGAELAILPEDRRDNSPCITAENISTLEQDIDLMNESLTPLTSFILPGGNQLAATCHLARAVCRRVERIMFALNAEAKLNELCLQFINRLSDWLFVAARYVCHESNVRETLWQPH